VRANAEFEGLSQDLSITTFRFVPLALKAGVGTASTEQQIDEINHEILTRLENSGEAFLSNAVVDGKFALRACIVNFRTSLEDIEGLLPIIARIGREVAST
jgi:hypothetical protein